MCTICRTALPALVALALTALPAHAAGFTTAAEVKPILNATKSAWIKVREYDGQDLVYFTHLESWRCGLDSIRYGLNTDTADTLREMEPCYEDEPAPNAIKADGHLPFITQPLGSVNTITIEINYDDGTSETAQFERANIMMP